MGRWKRMFSDEAEQEMCRIYGSGISAAEIARRNNVTPRTISLILQRWQAPLRSSSDRNRIYSLDVHAFDHITTEAQAYWLGFLFADGNVSGGRIVRLYVAESDREILVKFRDFMKSTAPIRDFTVTTNKKVDARQSNINMTDLYLGRKLNDLGIIPNRKHDGVSWRVCFSAVPKELQHHWIRGWFDGDGAAHTDHSPRGPSLSFSGPKELLIEVRRIITEEKGTNPDLKISENTNYYVNHPIYALRYAGRNILDKVVEFLYQDAHVWLERKRVVVDRTR
jgi:hypothetical protein